MKKTVLFFAFIIAVGSAYSTKVEVKNSSNTFTPSSITINLGDTVVFAIYGSHDVVEVSQATWNSNGNVSNGGFSTPFGGGKVIPKSAGTFYYVCTPHAAVGMKGMITVKAPSALNHTFYDEGFGVFPNPAVDYVYVRIILPENDVVTIELLDITGRKVSQLLSSELPSGQYQGKFSIDRSLQAGRYFIKVIHNGRVHCESLIIR